MSAPTTVLVVDDHALVREGLSAVVELQDDLTVVGTAATVREALARHDEHQPDVVVTDLQLPDGTGLDIVRTLREHRLEVGVVIVTMHAGDEQVFAALQAGASAFVGKDAPSAEVVQAVRSAAAAPHSFVSRGLLHAVVRRQDSHLLALTEREHDVLLLLAEGLGSAAIGERLYLAESTVKAHVSRIYHKLGAGNRSQALVTAMRAGLLSSVGPPGR